MWTQLFVKNSDSVTVASVMVASVIHDSYQFQIDSQHIIGLKNKLRCGNCCGEKLQFPAITPV